MRAVLSVPAMAAAQTREAESQITVQGTVEAVDYKARTVTIRGRRRQRGDPRRAARSRRGSIRSRLATTVTATYYDRVSMRVKPAGEPPVDRTVEPTTTATPGALPGATRTRQRVTTVTITGWDPADKVVSFTGPNGTAYSR